MYATQKILLDDIKIVQNTLDHLNKDGFDHALDYLGQLIWGDLHKPSKILRFRLGRFYMIFGYACLWALKSIVTLDKEDLKKAKDYADQSKNTAQRLVGFFHPRLRSQTES